MSSKTGSSSKGKSMSGGTGTKGKARAQTVAASTRTQTTTDSTKGTRPRKPPVFRASRLASQINKKHTALLKLVEKWQGESTPEQKDACTTALSALRSMKPDLTDLSVNIAYLLDTKWAPKSGAPGRKPLQVGQRVIMKEKRYTAAFGPVNSFEVVSVADPYVLIRPAGTEASGTPVLRAWISEDPNGEPVDAEAATDDLDKEIEGEGSGD